MFPPNPLQRLRDLDRSSTEFPDKLTGILTEGWIDQAQNLSPEGLRELIECLDNVSVQITFTRSLLISVEDPQFPRPHQSCFLPLFVRTSKDLWCPQDLANVACTPAYSFGHERHSDRLWNLGKYTRGDSQRFEGLR